MSKIDELLRIKRAIDKDFKDLLKDTSIPLEKRMEWFANYSDEFLCLEVKNYIFADYVTEMLGYIEEGWDKEDISRIEEILLCGVRGIV